MERLSLKVGGKSVLLVNFGGIHKENNLFLSSTMFIFVIKRKHFAEEKKMTYTGGESALHTF